MRKFHQHSRGIALALVLGSGLVACGAEDSQDSEEIGSVGEKIINGDVVETDNYYTALVRVFNSAGTRTCSGTMIGNRWVLTAHRCVTQEDTATGGTAVEAGNVLAQLKDGAAAPGKNLYRHPTLDVALIELQSDLVPAGGKAVPLYSNRVDDLPEDYYYCQGWGDNTYTGGAGTLRSASLDMLMGGWDPLVMTRPFGAGTELHQIQWTGDFGSSCFYNGEAISVTSHCSAHDSSGNPRPDTDNSGDVTYVDHCFSTAVDYFRDWAMSTMGKVVSGVPGKCLDVKHGETADHTVVQLYDCNDSQSQTWTPESDGTIRAFGKCLDVSGDHVSSGSLVQLYHCNGSQSQQWVRVREGGKLMNPRSGRCLGVPAGDTSGQLHIFDCRAPSPEQFWTVSARTKLLAARDIPGLCLQRDPNADWRDTSVPLVTATCTGTEVQQWWLQEDGTLQDTSGLCVDVYHSGTADRTPVQLHTCNGTGAQQWVKHDDDSLYNPQSGKCLDIPHSSTTPGTQLQIYQCNGTNAQKWTWGNVGKGIRNTAANLCLHTSNSSGSTVELELCLGGSSFSDQTWILGPDETVRAYGKCLDVVNGSTTKGAPVQLHTCNGTGAQQWVMREDHSLYNPASGRCLDDPNSSTSIGTQLQIWDCNGSSAQKWIVE